MAGLAALMTRKKRDRRREMELMREKLSDPVAMAELSGKDAEEALKVKAAHETIKKMLSGKELLHQKSKQSFDALSQVSYQDNDDDTSKQGGFKNGDSVIYIGLILICIGVVITFVGLGEKGFKTIQLKLIGPVLCLVGLACVLLKIIQCSFPQLFQCPTCFRRKKLADKDRQISLMEKGSPNNKRVSIKRKNQMKDRGASEEKMTEIQDQQQTETEKKTQIEQSIPSPRVTLHSAKKPPTATVRPRSTIPNYIEASSDEDDFDPERKWRQPETHNRSQASLPHPVQVPIEHTPEQTKLKFQNPQGQGPSPLPRTDSSNALPKASTKTTPTPTALSPVEITSETNSASNKQQKKEEIVLAPKGLRL